MSKIKNLAFLSAIISFTFTLNSHAADNCTVTAPATNVNLNYAQAGRVSADFKNCKIRVRPAFQWSNPQGTQSVFRLDGKPDVYIPVSLFSRIGANWDASNPMTGVSQPAVYAYTDYNSLFSSLFSSSNQPKNLTTYAEFSSSHYSNLAQYPVGTYRASLTFSAVEW
ncbi:hypothetical protein [Acinetobacter pragensis]|uniref:Spore coat protein U domain-containing protein n=1 Tax=Acinetobacter pragensis TaxID=1806892 RepID=A0A151XY97_9GAMM|nr:hypothetical protein [Acinetobacter pragensis]KYQ70808.1 hypothetical protein AZH43_03440 [Acinetobacter pragensis]